MTDVTYQWIGSDADLAGACEQWLTAGHLAVDTEFVRTETYYARLGLIQIGLDARVWLIDPQAITDWTPLKRVLEAPDVVKIFHSLSEDAEVLHNSAGIDIGPVFDTQIGAAFSGYDLQMGFARLVSAAFSVDLPKDVTRSDWTRRPLAPEQCDYAAADVYWLERLYLTLAPPLREQGRFEWVLEDSQRAARDSLPLKPEQYYLRIKGAWKLKGARLLCLQQLAAWREREARDRDVNRSRVLSDGELLQIANAMPRDRAALAPQKGLSPRKVRQFGDAVCQCVLEADKAGREQWPQRLPGPLPADQAALFKDVKRLLADIAERIALPPEVLARRKQLEQLVRSGCYDGAYQVPEMMTGWRREPVARPLIDYLVEQRHADDV